MLVEIFIMWHSASATNGQLGRPKILFSTGKYRRQEMPICIYLLIYQDDLANTMKRVEDIFNQGHTRTKSFSGV